MKVVVGLGKKQVAQISTVIINNLAAFLTIFAY
jgi:hypothetical protein